MKYSFITTIIFKNSLKFTTVTKNVNTFSCSLPISIISTINMSIRKSNFYRLNWLIINPLSWYLRIRFKCFLYTFSIFLSIYPRAFKCVSIWIKNYSLSLLFTIIPISLINLSLIKINSLSLFSIFQICSIICSSMINHPTMYFLTIMIFTNKIMSRTPPICSNSMKQILLKISIVIITFWKYL